MPLNVENARCSNGIVAIDTDFPAGALASCSVGQSGNVKIVLSPEDAPPINCSAWYAFRVQAGMKQQVKIDLNYTECGHRYWPKVSTDGKVWTRLSESHVELSEFAGKKMARLTLTAGTDPIFVSAQEIVVPATYDSWLDGLEAERSIRRSLLGRSAEGRPIEIIRFGNKAAREQLVLVGRQHPPEVTGALAMFPFVETLLGDDPLAKRFRDRFEVIAVPLLNPDGVVKGHWRHNTGGIDLNRDWGPFTQPETRLMQGVLERVESAPNQNLRLMLDFHSTQRDIFYSIPDELPTDPPLFTRDWLARYQERMTDYEVVRDARHTVGRPVSKAHVFDTYGVPGVTFEIGDETDRKLIGRIGKQSAMAVMETLLKTPEK
ncbi:MAG: M14-type cytosolic carboxypeptidase [Marinomonas sp.]